MEGGALDVAVFGQVRPRAAAAWPCSSLGMANEEWEGGETLY